MFKFKYFIKKNWGGILIIAIFMLILLFDNGVIGR